MRVSPRPLNTPHLQPRRRGSLLPAIEALDRLSIRASSRRQSPARSSTSRSTRGDKTSLRVARMTCYFC